MSPGIGNTLWACSMRIAQNEKAPIWLVFDQSDRRFSLILHFCVKHVLTIEAKSEVHSKFTHMLFFFSIKI